jgi:hypothetical protein
MDFFALPNEATERGVYFSLMGVGDQDWEGIRRLARRWLETGEVGIADPSRVAPLQPVFGEQQHPKK